MFVVNAICLEKDQKKNNESMKMFCCVMRDQIKFGGQINGPRFEVVSLLFRFAGTEHEMMYGPVDGDISKQVQQTMGVPLILFG